MVGSNLPVRHPPSWRAVTAKFHAAFDNDHHRPPELRPVPRSSKRERQGPDCSSASGLNMKRGDDWMERGGVKKKTGLKKRRLLPRLDVSDHTAGAWTEGTRNEEKKTSYRWSLGTSSM